jgi:hypothetical protein
LDGDDLIILGTYSSPRISTYVDPLGITLPSYGEGPSDIDIPGFGKIPSDGIGLVLLSRTKERTALILLADAPYSLTSLMNELGPNGISNCLLQGNVAICGFSGGGSHGDYGA